jgi:hypothetical protein
MNNGDKRYPICNSAVIGEMFTAIVRRKHKARYRFCGRYGFLFVESPEWPEEAHKVPINDSGREVMAQNLLLSRITSVILYFLFNKKDGFLDWTMP